MMHLHSLLLTPKNVLDMKRVIGVIFNFIDGGYDESTGKCFTSLIWYNIKFGCTSSLNLIHFTSYLGISRDLNIELVLVARVWAP